MGVFLLRINNTFYSFKFIEIMQKSLFNYDITEIDKVSKIIIELIKQKNKVLFSGPIGSGKTTLIKNVI